MLDWVAVRRRLLIAVAIVAGLGLVAEVWHQRTHDALIEALLPKLSLSYESNVPTWFSSALLLACAVAAGAIAAARPPWHRHWWVISAVAAYLSLDETAELHEHLGGHIDTGGVVYFDWVIPGAILVTVIVLLFIPFVRALDTTTRRRLILAGVIYVGGALVMELPLGWWSEQRGGDSLGYALIDWVEETMEMIGATLAFVALLAHRKDMQK